MQVKEIVTAKAKDILSKVMQVKEVVTKSRVARLLLIATAFTITGFALLAYATNWMVALAIFLILWGNNINNRANLGLT